MFSSTTIAAMIVGAVLAFVIPIAAVVIFKLKNRDALLPSALVGMVTFVLFAMILEQIPGLIILPMLQSSTAAYIIYSALAAAIFGETGRLAAYKTVMKNNLTTKNAIMKGLGHGGFEMMVLLGFSMISFAASATMVANDGLETAINALAAGDSGAIDSIRAQLESFASFNFGNTALAVYERLLALTLNVCMSVLVFHAVTRPAQMKLYVLAVIFHTAFEALSEMYQLEIMILPVITALTALTAGIVYFTITITKKFTD